MSAEEENAGVVELNVVGTVSRPMRSKFMGLDLPRAFTADNETIIYFENQEVGLNQKSLEGFWYAVENEQWRFVVPQSKLRQSLIHRAHDALVAGYLAFNKAYELLGQGVTWPEIFIELKVYFRTCDSCKINKTSNQKPKGLLKPLEIPIER
jgi:Integrase zinc binding domain